MIDYRVRSVSLLNLVNDIRNGRLIPDAYFQRNLVWRDVHKIDFIKTILMGLPFPQIFISKGKVDVESMSTISCIVDGQQRSNAITEFIDDMFSVDGKYYSELNDSSKSDFLKYEVAVIELDLENDDPKVQEIFQRINRTSNSLSAIEKMASEFATSYFMLVSKLLADQIDIEKSDSDDFKEDPNIPAEFYDWAKKQRISKFNQLITKKGVFTQREISRKTHLMHVLNIMSSVIAGFYNRNDKAVENLNDYAENFPEKDEIVVVLERTAELVLSLKLKAKSYFYNKANLYSLVVAIATRLRNGGSVNIEALKDEIDKFEASVPEDFKLAASEAVNGTKARQLRNTYILGMLERADLA
tara:strand:- start:143 stop:1213 length:1071 start_codon:yes stop_codon:yes gene_type:complete